MDEECSQNTLYIKAFVAISKLEQQYVETITKIKESKSGYQKQIERHFEEINEALKARKQTLLQDLEENINQLSK